MALAGGASFLLVKFLAPASGAAVGRMKMQRRTDSARLKGWGEEGGRRTFQSEGKHLFFPSAYTVLILRCEPLPEAILGWKNQNHLPGSVYGATASTTSVFFIRVIKCEHKKKNSVCVQE